MSVIVECDVAAIVGINPFQGNDGPPEIAADIFNRRIRITEIDFGINIKGVFIFAVDQSLVVLKEDPLRDSRSLRRAV